MRKFLVPALFVLAALPATAEARTLWLKQARTVSARIAKTDTYINRYSPDWAGAVTTSPKCVRKTRTRATCDYRIDYTPTHPVTHGGSHRYCLRRVVVTLRRGHPRGHLMTNLDCGLQDMNQPDYEA